MKLVQFRLGTIGRCGCGSIGTRRREFGGEPVCDTCCRGRRGYLRVDPDGLIVGGKLTPAQRRARKAWLRNSHAQEAAMQPVIDDQMEAADGAALHGASTHGRRL